MEEVPQALGAMAGERVLAQHRPPQSNHILGRVVPANPPPATVCIPQALERRHLRVELDAAHISPVQLLMPGFGAMAVPRGFKARLRRALGPVACHRCAHTTYLSHVGTASGPLIPCAWVFGADTLPT